MEKKKLAGLFVIVPLLIALIFVGIGKNCCRPGGSNQLEIVRDNTAINASDSEAEAVLENGLIKKTFIAYPAIFDSHGLFDPAADPFAESMLPGVQKIADPKKVMESAGITFGKGASVAYNEITFELTAINTPDQMGLIEAFCSAIGDPMEKQLAIRAEIFEMPSLMALEVIESAAAEGTHSPERDALRKILGKGKVRLVHALTIMARSGSLAKIEDAQDLPLALSKTASIKKEDENGNRSDWEIRRIGTFFEVGPVVGADDFTIVMNLSLEHHTAVPDLCRTKSAYPPTLHAKKITTQITTQDGASILIGSWKPTGKPEYEKNDLMHLAFITANVQTLTAPAAIVE